jgi:ribose 5-phosphate isomerase
VALHGGEKSLLQPQNNIIIADQPKTKLLGENNQFVPVEVLPFAL